MKKSKLKKIIKEHIREAIVLKRYGDKIVAASDLEKPDERKSETFSNMKKLKQAGFKWDSEINHWYKPSSELSSAMQSATQLNPAHKIIKVLEDLPELIMSQKDFSEKKQITDKLDAYIDSLIEDVESAAGSEELQRLMTFQAKLSSTLKSYSLRNTALIYIQNPKATRIAGVKDWEKLHRKPKSEIGYFVMPKKNWGKANKIKKEIKANAGDEQKVAELTQRLEDLKTSFKYHINKGIIIFVPVGGKAKEELLDSPDKEKFIKFFKPVKVVDIADTEPIDERGEMPEVEWHANSEPNEVADKLTGLLSNLASNMGVEITHDDSKRGEQGYSAGDKINLSSHIAGVEKSATLAHEIAHELLHHKKTSIFYDESNPSNEMRELQAESIAYLILKHYDLPVKQMANYLAMWKANKEKIMKDLPTLKTVADFIIDKIDDLEETQ
jgi:hypothetical protein